jgi:hypothetical protein
MFVFPLLQWKSKKYYIFWVQGYSLRYTACEVHVPYNHLWPAQLYSIFLQHLIFIFQALNFLVESFGLLNDLFPLPSILDAGYPVFDLHLADVLCDVILPSVLGSSLWSFG